MHLFPFMFSGLPAQVCKNYSNLKCRKNVKSFPNRMLKKMSGLKRPNIRWWFYSWTNTINNSDGTFKPKRKNPKRIYFFINIAQKKQLQLQNAGEIVFNAAIVIIVLLLRENHFQFCCYVLARLFDRWSS